MEDRVFVSERIINMNELEEIIDSLKTNFIFLKRAIKKLHHRIKPLMMQ